MVNSAYGMHYRCAIWRSKCLQIDWLLEFLKYSELVRAKLPVHNLHVLGHLDPWFVPPYVQCPRFSRLSFITTRACMAQ